MEKNKELEYKILLNQQQFLQMNAAFPKAKTYTQTNYYLTSEEMTKCFYSGRVREKEGTYEMTVKKPFGAIGHMEHNLMISREDFLKIKNGEMIDNDITRMLKAEGFDLTQIKQAYSLKTIRHDIPLRYGMLSLDENFYLDRHDYEMEFEINDEEQGPAQFQELLTRFDLTYTGNAPSKIKRVLDALGH